jgi:hypothetical protein
MCVQERPNAYWRFIRNSIIFFLFIGACAFGGMSAIAGNLDGKHIFAGFAFGASVGMFIWQLFPHENHRR